MKELNIKQGGHPFKADDLIHIQSGFKQTNTAFLRSYDNTNGDFILSGCVITSSGGNTSITEGWICLDWVIYYVPAHTITTVSGTLHFIVKKYGLFPSIDVSNYTDTNNANEIGPLGKIAPFSTTDGVLYQDNIRKVVHEQSVVYLKYNAVPGDSETNLVYNAANISAVKQIKQSLDDAAYKSKVNTFTKLNAFPIQTISLTGVNKDTITINENSNFYILNYNDATDTYVKFIDHTGVNGITPGTEIKVWVNNPSAGRIRLKAPGFADPKGIAVSTAADNGLIAGEILVDPYTTISFVWLGHEWCVTSVSNIGKKILNRQNNFKARQGQNQGTVQIFEDGAGNMELFFGDDGNYFEISPSTNNLKLRGWNRPNESTITIPYTICDDWQNGTEITIKVSGNKQFELCDSIIADGFYSISTSGKFNLFNLLPLEPNNISGGYPEVGSDKRLVIKPGDVLKFVKTFNYKPKSGISIWKPDVNYSTGDKVYANFKVYTASNSVIGKNPMFNPNDWQIVPESSNDYEKLPCLNLVSHTSALNAPKIVRGFKIASSSTGGRFQRIFFINESIDSNLGYGMNTYGFKYMAQLSDSAESIKIRVSKSGQWNQVFYPLSGSSSENYLGTELNYTGDFNGKKAIGSAITPTIGYSSAWGGVQVPAGKWYLLNAYIENVFLFNYGSFTGGAFLTNLQDYYAVVYLIESFGSNSWDAWPTDDGIRKTNDSAEPGINHENQWVYIDNSNAKTYFKVHARDYIFPSNEAPIPTYDMAGDLNRVNDDKIASKMKTINWNLPIFVDQSQQNTKGISNFFLATEIRKKNGQTFSGVDDDSKVILHIGDRQIILSELNDGRYIS